MRDWITRWIEWEEIEQQIEATIRTIDDAATVIASEMALTELADCMMAHDADAVEWAHVVDDILHVESVVDVAREWVAA